MRSEVHPFEVENFEVCHQMQAGENPVNKINDHHVTLQIFLSHSEVKCDIGIERGGNWLEHTKKDLGHSI